MLKNYTLLSATLLFAGSLAAQPTLTHANVGFAAGDVYNAIYLDGAGMNPGPGGANQTWNFAQVPPTGTPLLMEIKSKAGSPYQSQFQGSNVYAQSSIGQDFYVATSTEWSRRATLSPGATVDFTDAEKFMVYPFTYNNSYTDNFAALITTNATLSRQGTISGQADGYGSVVLPGGQTVTGALRVKYAEDYTDNYMGTTNTYHADHYFWFKPGMHGPFLSYTSLTVNGLPYMKQASMAEFITVSAPESLEPAFSVELFPNPAKASVTVRTGFGQPVAATLINSLGQEAGKYTLLPTEDKLCLDGFSSGVYFLQLRAGENLVTKKIIIE